MQRSLMFLTFSLAMLVLSVADDARAQVPVATLQLSARAEVFGGYGYMRVITVGGPPVGLKGANFSSAYYVNERLGLVCDMGLYHQRSVAASGFSLNVQSYQFGPRLRLRNHARLVPFGQLLFGEGLAGGTLYTRSLPSGMPPLGTNTSFLFTAGGGVDWRLGSRIGVRIVQAEYLRSQFLNGSGKGDRQDNLRLSTGIVVKFW